MMVLAMYIGGDSTPDGYVLGPRHHRQKPASGQKNINYF